MKVGSLGGIGVYIHWTFWLLIAAYLVSVTMHAGLAAGLLAVAFVLSIFGCVLLHEFGHAGAAAAFGIPTADITLLPFGGVARLTRMPSKPYQELLIALAGPAVNVAIAGLLFVLLAVGVVFGGSVPFLGGMDFLSLLLTANVILVLFNLLPAFPMDGGRVLRSLLSMRTGHLRATEIAARVGRWMALGFGLYGIVYGPFTLLLVAGFIFFAGTVELMSARVQAATGGPAGAASGWRGAWPPRAQSVWTATTNADFGGDAATAPQPAHRRAGRDDIVDAIQVRHLN